MNARLFIRRSRISRYGLSKTWDMAESLLSPMIEEREQGLIK